MEAAEQEKQASLLRRNLLKGVPQRVLQRQLLGLQAGVVALQLLQAGAHDVQDGALDGPHGRRQRHMQLHHLRLVSVQRCVHRRLESENILLEGEHKTDMN